LNDIKTFVSVMLSVGMVLSTVTAFFPFSFIVSSITILHLRQCSAICLRALRRRPFYAQRAADVFGELPWQGKRGINPRRGNF
jgi:hypothetical protein